MFDGADLDRRAVLTAAEANLRARRAADVDLLEIAAAWADQHGEECLPPALDAFEGERRRLAGEVAVRLSGEGTPAVLAHCPGELGLVLETTYTGAKHLIADALDLRFRLPRLWETVRAGRVAAWKARRVAAATRPLTVEQAAEVDATVHTVIATLGWTRFEAILDATLKQVDPAGARAAEEEAATRRFVAVGRANDHHIMTLIARGDSLDVLSFLAAVNRIADILEIEGDPDPVDVRRARAIGILARPARALELLASHQAEEPTPPASGPGPEEEPDPEGDRYTSLEPTSPSVRQGAVGPCRCAPRIQLYVHLTDAAIRGDDRAAVCRVEGVGPSTGSGCITAATVRRWLGRSDASIVVRPVALPDPPAADSYEIPRRIREALQVRNPGSVYPWSNATGRTLDLDHTVPYRPPNRDGPPGQTGLHNLGPFARREHNVKTYGHARVRQPAPGVFLWRSRHGWIFLVTSSGTHPLGNEPTAQALWRAAMPREGPSPLERRFTDLLHAQGRQLVEIS